MTRPRFLLSKSKRRNHELCVRAGSFRTSCPYLYLKSASGAKCQSERREGERDVAEEDIELIPVEIDDGEKKECCDYARNEYAPAGEDPERNDEMYPRDEHQEDILRESDIPHKLRDIAEPVIGVRPEAVGGV